MIYSSLGINGANVTLLSHAFNERHWAAELRHYKPDLVIVNYGTNESGFAGFRRQNLGPEMKEVVRRLHAALPGASVLLMSPMDRGERKLAGEIETMPVLPRLVQIEARVAHGNRRGFFQYLRSHGRPGNHGPLVCGRASPGRRGFHPSHARRRENRRRALVQRPPGWV